MEDFIKDIYDDSNVIFEVKRCIEMVHRRDVKTMSQIWKTVTPKIVELCKKEQIIHSIGTGLYSALLEACARTRQEDYIALGDCLDTLMPALYAAVEDESCIDVTEGNWRLFSSRSGFLTIQRISDKKTLMSAVDPMWDAYEHAKQIYDLRNNSFFIMGCELGYLAYQLYILSDKSLDIYIFEQDSDLVKYAFDYGVLSLIDEKKLHIFVDSDDINLVDKFCMRYEEGSQYAIGYFCYDWALTEFSREVQIIMQHFNIENDTAARGTAQAKINYYRNVRNIKKSIRDVVLPKQTSHFAIVAGGPSVDDHLERLRSLGEDTIIITVNTSHKKMIESGVHPDFVTTFDPLPNTYRHFEGLNDYSVPLIMYVTGNWRFSEYYKGEKYLISEDYKIDDIPGVDMTNRNNWYADGTVTSLAIEVAIKLGATRIDLYGVDLSYPNGMSHATGTPDLQEMNTEHMRKVPSVDGGEVPTLENMAIYIEDISKQAAVYSDVLFVNYSNHGAVIDGTKWYKELDACDIK